MIELKEQLKREREEEARKRQHFKYTDSIRKLEKEYNLQVILNSKSQLSLKNEKKDNDTLRLELSKTKEHLKSLETDNL